MKKPNQIRANRNGAKPITQLKANLLRRAQQLIEVELPPAAIKFLDEIVRSVRKHPKTERVRVIRLTKKQAENYNDSVAVHRSKSFLKEFLEVATLQQLFPLVGATPMCWDRQESHRSKWTCVFRVAIVHPTADEFGTYGITATIAEKRRAMVAAEVLRRQSLSAISQRSAPQPRA